MIDLPRARVLVTGGHGFLGKWIRRELQKLGVADVRMPTRQECDLLTQEGCERAVRSRDVVIHAAGKVGGIGANKSQPGAFFYENALMGMQLLEAARRAAVQKFVQVGTVCSYPKVLDDAPFREEDLWSGYPEETNGPYGLAKKALLVQGQAYRAQYGLNVIHLLQVNLYGPGDHFGSEGSHVLPALVDRFWKAKQQALPEVVLWGTGAPTREFLYVEEAARGIVLAAERYDGGDPVNLGSGQEISIRDLAERIRSLVGYTGSIMWDTTKPDGQPRRLFDSSKAERLFGFQAAVSFDEGLRRTIAWYAEHVAGVPYAVAPVVAGAAAH